MTIESSRAARRGFTLVELLMVIVIVGILAALVSAGVLAALNRGKQARVLTEINQLDLALENYKSQYGGYPPSFGLPVVSDPPGPDPGQETLAQRQERFMRHVRLAFPRETRTYSELRTFIMTNTQYTTQALPSRGLAAANGGNGLDINHLDAAEALVFWLGGLPDRLSETLTSGFSADPQSPFLPRANANPSDPQQPQRQPRLYEFDPRRLVDRDGDGWWEYVQDQPSEVMPPYVYFDAPSYGLDSASGLIRASYPSPPGDEDAVILPSTSPALFTIAANWGYCRPNVSSITAGGVNPTRFQIISAGLDRVFGWATGPIPVGSPLDTDASLQPPFSGAFGRFPGGPFREYEGDNLTNFSERKLEDVEP